MIRKPLHREDRVSGVDLHWAVGKREKGEEGRESFIK
jgi:hypothetical protein